VQFRWKVGASDHSDGTFIVFAIHDSNKEVPVKCVIDAAPLQVIVPYFKAIAFDTLNAAPNFELSQGAVGRVEMVRIGLACPET
jgi:hypothetical protein